MEKKGRGGSNKLTVEEVLNRLPDHLTLDISTYKNVTTKAKFIDREYGEFWITPNKVFNNRNHKLRGKQTAIDKLSLSVDEVKRRLPNYLILKDGSFINTYTKATFIDSEYGEFEALPKSIFKGTQHPKRRHATALEKNKLTEREINEKLPSYIKVDFSTYTNRHTKARFIDDEYGEWWTCPGNLFQGYEHPARWAGRSNPELELFKFINDLLKDNRVESLRKKYEIDVYVPDFKIGFEYHGLYWHNSDNVKKNYHLDKRTYFRDMDITVIQIYADEWTHKPEIVKSIIKSKLGMSDTKYYARNLSIRDVLSKDADIFLKENHLMGRYKSAKHVGLFDKDDLVSLVSYKKHKDGIDISRFCNKLNSSVAGGLSRLLKEIERREQPKFIQSWVDLRYGTGSSLLGIGFEYSHTSLGWKWTDNHITYNRLYCRANMDHRKLSEKEYAEEMKLVKIYDAGQALFVKIKV